MYKTEPIVNLLTSEVFAKELLYSSRSVVESWSKQDCKMLSYIPAWDSSALLFINLTSASILSCDESMIKKCLVLKENLTIEWNEAFDSEEQAALAAERLLRWRDKFGIRIAIDDAGSGHDFTKRFHLVGADFIKLCGSVFQRSKSHAGMSMLCSDVADFAAKYNVPLIVEWVESASDMEYARHSLGAQYGQGHLFNLDYTSKLLEQAELSI